MKQQTLFEACKVAPPAKPESATVEIAIPKPDPLPLDLCPVPRKRRRQFAPNELDCMREIQCFVRFGCAALDRLVKVIDNIWAHYEVSDPETQERIMWASGACLALGYHRAQTL